MVVCSVPHHMRKLWNTCSSCVLLAELAGKKLGIFWPIVGNRLDLMHRSKESCLEPMFMEVFIFGAWGIWKERNNKYFRGVPPSVHSWTLRFKEDFDLLRHRSKTEFGPFITHLV